MEKYLQLIFSLKNSYSHKIFTICGIKLKFRRKKTPEENNPESLSVMDEYEKLKFTLCEKHKQYISDNVEIGEITYGFPEFVFQGEDVKLKIGKFCSLASGIKVFLKGDHNVNFVTTYPFNVLLPHNFGDINGHPVSKGDVIIGNDVWVASDVTIMSGVRIGDGAVVANKALVTKDISPYTIVGGVPAKVIRKRFDDETIEKLLKIQWWNWEDKHIVNAIRMLQSNRIEELIEYYYRNVM